MRDIIELSENEKAYLYGRCDEWVKEQFQNGDVIIAVIDSCNRENGLLHTFIKTNDVYSDIRGSSYDFEDMVNYVDIYGELDIYNFDELKDFKLFLKWLEFELTKEAFVQ